MLDHLEPQLVQQFLETLPASLALCDEKNQIVWVNDSFLRVSSQARTDLIGKTVAQLDADVQALFKEGHVFLEENSRRDAFWMACMATSIGKLTLYHCSDVTQLQSVIEERDTLKNKVAELNPNDSLTGMPNRRSLFQHLENQASRSRRYGNALSVMIMRLSNLSELVRTVGKDKADEVILRISQELNDQMRWADIIGRADANEFLFIMPETEEHVVQELRDKLKDKLSAISFPGINDFVLHAEFGMSQWRKGDDVGLLMERARHNLNGDVGEKLAV